MKGSDVLLAFGKSTILTRGSDTAWESDFKEEWKRDIEKYVERRHRLKEQLDSAPPRIDISYEEENDVH